MSGEIHFFNEDIPKLPLNCQDEVKQWLAHVLASHEIFKFEVNYIFCPDEYLHQINVDFLDHDTYTDIITFDNSTDDNLLEADIFISVERVAENAETFGVSFLEELHRVMVHGILHLCGLKDKTPEQAASMKKGEDQALALREKFSIQMD